MLCSIQYRVIKENADDAFYELQNPKEQIQAFVFDGNFCMVIWKFLAILCSKFSGFLVSFTLDSWCYSDDAFCCVLQVVRAHVPRMTLDELFEQKGDVAQTVLEELEKVIWCCYRWLNG